MPAHAPDVPPSNIFAAPPSSTAPVILSVDIPGLIPRRSALPRSSSATGSPPLPRFLTDRRTPTSPSTFAAKRPSHGLSPAPFQTHSPLAITAGWDRAAQDVLDTPIEEEDHRLDVDMSGDGYMENEYTSGSTPLQAPTTDDEPPPPSTPNGEDMEVDADALEEANTSVSVVPVQGRVPVPASVANVSSTTAIVQTSDSSFTDWYSASSIVPCQSLSSELIFEYRNETRRSNATLRGSRSRPHPLKTSALWVWTSLLSLRLSVVNQHQFCQSQDVRSRLPLRCTYPLQVQRTKVTW